MEFQHFQQWYFESKSRFSRWKSTCIIYDTEKIFGGSKKFYNGTRTMELKFSFVLFACKFYYKNESLRTVEPLPSLQRMQSIAIVISEQYVAGKCSVIPSPNRDMSSQSLRCKQLGYRWPLSCSNTFYHRVYLSNIVQTIPSLGEALILVKQ